MKKFLAFGMMFSFLFYVQAQVVTQPAQKSDNMKAAQAAPSPSKCETKDCQTMMKLKKEYFQKNFTLQPEQEKDFWNAFDAYANTEFDAFKSHREALAKVGIDHRVPADSVQYLSDDQIRVLYSSRLELRSKLLKAENEFFKSISKCLSAKQLNEYYQLEQKFKRSAAKHQHKPGCCEKEKPMLPKEPQTKTKATPANR